ncbi:MAG TPA: transcription elongation factor GreB [Polyangiaceae bacterium]|jgi:transcription elongation factor GreB|nr:transcription elongation factor GreB [Polyangiaceae bacterium]
MATYLTLHGARRFSDELRRLVEVDRPKVVQEVADAAAQGDRSENAEYIYGKKRLREIDRRIRFLTQRLDDCTVVDLNEAPQDSARVFFGAVVTLEDEEGEEKRYQLVGPDEVDAGLGLISYLSPLGKVLLRRAVGETLTVQRPAGETDYTVLAIDYGIWLGSNPKAVS